MTKDREWYEQQLNEFTGPRIERVYRLDLQTCRLIRNQFERHGEVDILRFYQLEDTCLCEYLLHSPNLEKFLDQQQVKYVDDTSMSLRQALSRAHLSPWFLFENLEAQSRVLAYYLEFYRPILLEEVAKLIGVQPPTDLHQNDLG